MLSAKILMLRQNKDEAVWIVKTTQAIDEMVPPIQPQPDLENTVVVPHPGWFLQHPSPLHESRA